MLTYKLNNAGDNELYPDARHCQLRMVEIGNYSNVQQQMTSTTGSGMPASNSVLNILKLLHYRMLSLAYI